MPDGLSKQRKAYCRKLYLAWLVAGARHDLRSLQEATGMPRRTIQDSLADLADIGIACRFIQDGPKHRHGYYAIEDWGDHDARWIAQHWQRLEAMLHDG